MPLTPADSAWFAAHPGRAFRTRAISRAEASYWRRPPTDDLHPWIVVRRTDGAERRYTLPAHTALDDTDAELGPIFARLPDPQAQGPRTFAPVCGGTLARIEGRLVSLLMASAPFEPDAPPAVAYREEIRARGREALAIGGRDALYYLADRIASTAPACAEVRAAILDVAWRGLAEARP